MQIQTNTDNHIDGHEALAGHVETVVHDKLRHQREHVTRVEVHLSDGNSAKAGADDKRCVMEARLKNHQPVAVSHQAASLHQAIDGATTKLRAALEKLLDRLHDHGHEKHPAPEV